MTDMQYQGESSTYMVKISGEGWKELDNDYYAGAVLLTRTGHVNVILHVPDDVPEPEGRQVMVAVLEEVIRGMKSGGDE